MGWTRRPRKRLLETVGLSLGPGQPCRYPRCRTQTGKLELQVRLLDDIEPRTDTSDLRYCVGHWRFVPSRMGDPHASSIDRNRNRNYWIGVLPLRPLPPRLNFMLYGRPRRSLWTRTRTPRLLTPAYGNLSSSLGVCVELSAEPVTI